MNSQIRKERVENFNNLEDLDFSANKTDEQEISAILALNPDMDDNNKEQEDKEEDITNLVDLMEVTDYSPPTNDSPSSTNQISVEDDIIQQEG